MVKGYLSKLLGNDAVKSYITRHEPGILEHFELVMNTVSMEEAVQQQLEADGEFEEPPEDDVPERKGWNNDDAIVRIHCHPAFLTLHCRIATPKGQMLTI